MPGQVDTALANEKERLAITLSSIGDGVIATDNAERIVMFNAVAEQLTGWTQADAMGKPLAQVFHIVNHKTRAAAEDPARRALEGGAPVGLETDTVLVAKDGHAYFISSSVAPIRDPAGRTTGVVLVFRDVTRLKQAEAALKESREFARNLIDSSLDMIIAVDRDRKITEFNPAAEKTFGYLRDEVRGLDASLLYADQTESTRVQRTMAETGRLVEEVHNRRKDGTPFVAFLSSSQLLDARGEPLGVMGISRDITELKKAEEQTLRAERLAALGQMAAALAHEINNPLQAIRSILDLVLDFSLEAEERENNLRIIREEIERLSEVTERVLNFARPTRVPRRAVSVTELLQHTLTLAGKHLQHSRVQVTTDLPAIPPVFAAPEQLTQVFLNLVLNAIEEMSAGGHLQITARAEADHAVVSFTNDGAAMPPEVQPRIFEPFFTTKPEGNGLGLSISQTLVTQQGGSITAENVTSERGVVFTIRLPFAEVDLPKGSV